MAETTGTKAEAGPASSLQKYEQLKLDLAAVVRAVMHLAHQRGDEATSEQCRKLLARLAEDRFNLVVAGEFNRGKTSLMNAILGMDRLPTGVLPLTSVVTTVCYGDRERVLIRLRGWSLPREVTLQELSQFVTEEGNPGNEKQVELAEVQLPAELLRLGFFFIDTPGVGSGIAANSAATREFLPEADAVIFVTSFDSPLRQSELEFLDQVHRHVRKVFVVINKLDLVSPDEQSKVLEYVRGRLDDISPFPVSARDALLAKLNNDPERLAHSGLPGLEEALRSFLRAEKSRELLARVADRLERLLHCHETELALSKIANSDPERAALLLERIHGRLETQHEQVQAEVNRLRCKLISEFPGGVMNQLQPWRDEVASELGAQVRSYLATADFSSLLEGAPGLAEALKTTCQRTLAAWVHDHRGDLEQLAQELIGKDLERLEQALEGMVDSAGNASAEDKGAYGPQLPRWMLGGIPFPVAPDFSWEFRAPFWTYLVPLSLSRSYIAVRCVRRLKESMGSYMELIRAAIQQESSAWIVRLDRGVAERVAVITSRVEQVFHGGQLDPGQDAEVNRIRTDLEGLKTEIQRLGEGVVETLEAISAIPPQETLHSKLTATCTICNRVEAAIFDFMSKVQHELTVNEGEKVAHAERGGFCALHTWQYGAIAAPQDICVAYPPVLLQIARRLLSLAQQVSSAESWAGGVERLLARVAPCRACQLKAAVERSSIREVLLRLQPKEGDMTGRLPPLCLPHLQMMVEAHPGTDLERLLIREQAIVFERLAENMERYAIKHDAIRRQLATGEERQSHYIALSRLAGNRNIATPWRWD